MFTKEKLYFDSYVLKTINKYIAFNRLWRKNNEDENAFFIFSLKRSNFHKINSLRISDIFLHQNMSLVYILFDIFSFESASEKSSTSKTFFKAIYAYNKNILQFFKIVWIFLRNKNINMSYSFW